MQLPGLTMTDVDEVANRITLGFESPEAVEATLARALSDKGIPQSAVQVRAFQKVPTTQTLDDLFSPLPGGVNVRSHPSKGFCTLAAIIKYNGTDAFIGSSHCSPTQGAVDTSIWWNNGTLGFLGSEIADPGSLCPPWFPVKCRRSDATVVGVGGYPVELGKLARTKGVGWNPPGSFPGNDTIDVARPRFHLTPPGYTTTNPINGVRVHRVGLAWHWVSGLINETCSNYNQTTGWQMACNYRYSYPTSEGDSGGPVFYKIACPDDPPTETNCATFIGIHWGGSVNSYYSPVSGILLDFAPATFTFVPP